MRLEKAILFKNDAVPGSRARDVGQECMAAKFGPEREEDRVDPASFLCFLFRNRNVVRKIQQSARLNDEVRKERLVDMYYFRDPRDLIKNRVTEQMNKLMQSPAGKEGVGKKESRASRGSELRSFREQSQKKKK